jgi:CRISPR/Cas system-associated exonuclease Cas4 (RecB family)
MLPEYTSPSALNTYSSCPRRFRLKYLDNIAPEHRSVSLALGSAIHSVIGWWYGQKADGVVPDIEEALKVTEADLQAGLDGGNIQWGRWNQTDLTEHARRLVRCFLEERGDLPIVAMEAPLQLRLPGVQRPLIGFLDIVTSDGGIVEIKTAKSPYSQVDIKKNLQFSAYRYAMQSLRLGKYFSLLTLIKTKQPRLEEIRLGPLDEQEERFFTAAVREIEDAIAAGHFPPALGGFGCNTCEYQQHCLGIGVENAEAA